MSVVRCWGLRLVVGSDVGCPVVGSGVDCPVLCLLQAAV